MQIILISFCLITGIYCCENVNSDCLVHPNGCEDDSDAICCTISWKVSCCCKTEINLAHAVIETSTETSFIITSSIFDRMQTANPSSATSLATEKFSVHATIDRKSNTEGASVNVSLTSNTVRIFYAASDNTTSLRVHLDARSILGVSLVVSLVILLLILAFIVLICYSDRMRTALYRRLRIALRERHSPPPSIYWTKRRPIRRLSLH